MSVQPNISLLKSVPLLSGVSDSTLQSLVKHATLRSLKRGETLFIHGDKVEYFYIVTSGWLRLYRETLNGDEAVLGLVTSEGVLCPETLSSQHTYSLNCQIVDDATIVVLPIYLLRQYMENDSAFAIKLMEVMSGVIHDMQMQIEHLNVMTASQKVGCFLLKVCKDGSKGGMEGVLPCDKVVIAAYLGIKPETFSRALQQLKLFGVQMKGANVVIENADLLKSHCCLKCSGDMGCRHSDIHQCGKGNRFIQ
jgi:CRP-like cAMP-binding protein